jgi:Flp pilus assembly protein TadD
VFLTEVSDRLMDSKQLESFRHRVALGTQVWERGQFDTALRIFEGLAQEHPNFPDLQNKVGLSRAMLGDREGALEAFQRANELEPSYAEAHANRGIILSELGRHDEAARAFFEATRLDHRHGTIPSDAGNRIANVHADLGDLYVRARHFEEAIDQYRKALLVRPSYPDIRARLAEALIEVEDFEGARVELEKALEANDNLHGARVRLGWTLYRLGDVAGAVREWMLVSRLDPNDSRPRAYLARAGVDPTLAVSGTLPGN